MDQVDRIERLIEECRRRHPEAQPCRGDWQRSWTEYDGEILVWFNVPVAGIDAAAGMTTKIYREGN